MAFTRDFTGAPEGALKVNGPIQIAQGNLANGAGEYIPASGELFLYNDTYTTYLYLYHLLKLHIHIMLKRKDFYRNTLLIVVLFQVRLYQYC